MAWLPIYHRTGHLVVIFFVYPEYIVHPQKSLIPIINLFGLVCSCVPPKTALLGGVSIRSRSVF